MNEIKINPVRLSGIENVSQLDPEKMKIITKYELLATVSPVLVPLLRFALGSIGVPTASFNLNEFLLKATGQNQKLEDMAYCFNYCQSNFNSIQKNLNNYQNFLMKMIKRLKILDLKYFHIILTQGLF